jgi:hypothetical protein
MTNVIDIFRVENDRFNHAYRDVIRYIIYVTLRYEHANHLLHKTLYSVVLVCREFHRVAQDPSIWKDYAAILLLPNLRNWIKLTPREYSLIKDFLTKVVSYTCLDVTIFLENNKLDMYLRDVPKTVLIEFHIELENVHCPVAGSMVLYLDHFIKALTGPGENHQLIILLSKAEKPTFTGIMHSTTEGKVILKKRVDASQNEPFSFKLPNVQRYVICPKDMKMVNSYFKSCGAVTSIHIKNNKMFFSDNAHYDKKYQVHSVMHNVEIGLDDTEDMGSLSYASRDIKQYIRLYRGFYVKAGTISIGIVGQSVLNIMITGDRFVYSASISDLHRSAGPPPQVTVDATGFVVDHEEDHDEPFAKKQKLE